MSRHPTVTAALFGLPAGLQHEIHNYCLKFSYQDLAELISETFLQLCKADAKTDSQTIFDKARNNVYRFNRGGALNSKEFGEKPAIEIEEINGELSFQVFEEDDRDDFESEKPPIEIEEKNYWKSGAVVKRIANERGCSIRQAQRHLNKTILEWKRDNPNWEALV